MLFYRKFLALGLVTCSVFNSVETQAQNNPQSWTIESTRQKCFVENQGQFALADPGIQVLYAYDQGPTRIYFTKDGISFNFLKLLDAPESEYKEEEEYEGEDNQQAGRKKTPHEADAVRLTWLGANPNTEIVVENQVPNYFSYSFVTPDAGIASRNFIPGYEKIIYKNIYPFTDIEYTFHPEEGIKYCILLHQGADPSLIKMKYDADREIEMKHGNLHIETRFGDIIDHAPLTYYKDNAVEAIPSGFVRTGNEISFKLKNYDASREVVIDPWTVTPAYVSNWDCVWECDADGAGNVYTIGGVTPMVLTKYNAAGAVQWTYNTPYDTSMWLGTLATDNSGNSYVTNGSTQRILKVNSAGTLQFSNNSPGGAGLLTEFWSIAFNCDETKLVIGGTGGGGLTPTPYAYDVSTATGAVLASKKLAGGGGLFNSQEARAITPCGNAKYYWMAHDTLGYFHQNFAFCPGQTTELKLANGFSLGYKCENWRYDNTGVCAIKANTNYLYLNRGNVLQRRDLNTGAVNATVAIAGGNFASNQMRNSGIDIDACGNVYVGSINQVAKFDANLTQLATYTTSYTVFDVHVTTGGNIIACGATGTSGTASRTGYIQQIAAGACATITLTCCDAAICGPANMCLTSGTTTLTSNTPGGTWSGTGVNASGVFDPTVAGVGIHIITYSLSCGTGTFSITVTPTCAGLQVCQESDGSLTVSNGIATYTWSQYVPASSTPITTSAQCTACGYTWFFGSCLQGNSCPVPAYWTNFSTNPNSGTLPGTFPIKVTDATGVSITINSTAGIPACTTTLPVELLYFKGTCSEKEIELNWATASELNNRYFIVEASDDGIHFTPLKTIPGAGTSLVNEYYSIRIVDENASGRFFRLKQVDLNGSAAYSSIIHITCSNGNGTLTVHPNPAQDKLNVWFMTENEGEAVLTATDALGHTILTKKVTTASGGQGFVLDISDLQQGIYFLKIELADLTRAPESIKFIKQGK